MIIELSNKQSNFAAQFVLKVSLFGFRGISWIVCFCLRASLNQMESAHHNVGGPLADVTDNADLCHFIFFL